MNLETMSQIVNAKGPDRVVIDREGEALPPERAKRDHNVVPDVVFLRDDGWTLGAPRSLADVARSMWAGDWVGVMDPFPGKFEYEL